LQWREWCPIKAGKAIKLLNGELYRALIGAQLEPGGIVLEGM